MKTVFLFLLCIAYIFQPTSASGQTNEPVSIETGSRTSIDSKILNEKRNLLIHLPQGYSESTNHYPVLYLLDGNRHFDHATIAATILQEEDRVPDLIIVGIPNSQGTRGRDLSRERAKFVQFIKEEVAEYIDKYYRTTGLNTLFGHSMAAYFTMHFLAVQPELFKNYIAASPALQSNNEEVYNKFLELINTQQALDLSLYFTLTDEAEEGESGTKSLNAFVELLKEKSPEKLNWHYEFIANQVHMTTPYITLYEGLTFVFKSYQAPRFSSHSDFTNFGGMKALERHYQKRADIYGTDKKIPEKTLSDLANVLLDDGQTDMALKIYVDLTNRYPNSAAVYSGLGEVYKSMKQYEKSIEAHEKAVELSTKLSPGWQRFIKNRLEQVKNSLVGEEDPA